MLITANSALAAQNQALTMYPDRFHEVVSVLLYEPRGRTATTPVPGSTIDLQQQRAAQAQQPAAQPAGGGSWTGQWIIKDSETGRALYKFGGIGNSQADANRTARNWANDNNRGGGIEVVPEMA